MRRFTLTKLSLSKFSVLTGLTLGIWLAVSLASDFAPGVCPASAAANSTVGLAAAASTATVPAAVSAAPAAPAATVNALGLLFVWDEVPIPPELDLKSPVPVGPETALPAEEDLAPVVAAAEAAQVGDSKPHIYTHEVVAGDTLWDIAAQYGVSLDTVIGANPDCDPSLLKVGQVIKVPSVDGAVHVVQAGDTLSGLAAKYKVDPDVILGANDIADPDKLVVGQELIIPGATPVIVRKVTTQSGRTATVTAKFRWPVSGIISSRYGWRNGRFHHGVDIAAPYGTTIVAARAGKVIYAGWQSGYGNTIILSHGDGLTTLYGHASKLLVGVGQWVSAGQAIALVGSTGNSTGPHLHFEIRVNGSSTDPLRLLP